MKLIPILFILLLTSSIQANGLEGVYEVLIKKQAEKESNRWSLASWLGTKKKIALMDQWLALHSSSSWFEMYLEGTQGDLDAFESTGNQVTSKASRYQASAYVRALGVQYGMEKFPGFMDTKFLQANLILFGTSAQSTNIQLHYGQRTLETNFGEFKPNYWGASGTLYVLSFLGGIYEYKKFSEKAGYLGGDRLEYGGFVDILFFRIKGTFFKERTSFRRTDIGDYGQHLSGWWLGGQLFF